MRYSDLPDLPERAFQRKPGGAILPQGGKGSAPKAPDYTQLAREQAQSNMDLARYATQANRVNQVTPWGTISWDNGRTFDQAGYDAAMRAYQSAGGGSSGTPNFNYSGRDQAYARVFGEPVYRDGQWGWLDRGGGDSTTTFIPMKNQPGGGPGSPGGGAAAPNPADFYSSGDNWTQTMQLSPEMQALFDQYNRVQQGLFAPQNATLQRVQDMYRRGFNPDLPQGGDAFAIDPSALTLYDPTRETNNATDLLMQRINPQLDRQESQLRARLANQGITEGSAAYNNALAELQRGRNDAYSQASLQGIGLGMQQQGLQFNQGLQQQGLTLQQQQLADALRRSAFTEQSYLRNLPLQELQALTQGTQVQMPQFPGYAQQATTGGPDLVGAANAQYQGQLGAYNAQQAQNQGMMGGLGGLLGAGLGYFFPPAGMSALGSAGLGSAIGSGVGGLFSDRRLKRNIRRIGQTNDGLSIYAYEYVWGGPTQAGVMADEVEQVIPDAVGTLFGFKTVDYSKVH